MPVLIQDSNGNPLKSISPGYARRLIDNKKAEVVSTRPFVIKMAKTHALSEKAIIKDDRTRS